MMYDKRFADVRQQRWGIDLGGTKIEGVIINEEHPGQALYRLRLPTEQAFGYNHILAQVQLLVEQLEQASGLIRPKCIGIGTPGVIDPSTGVLKNSNTLCLNGRPVREDLTSVLGAQVHLANDANCFALAEATQGAARHAKVVMGLILGTGVGGGIIVQGHLIEGLHGIAGEWGHNTMRSEEAPCYCGKKGCNETVFSGPALERFYQEKTDNTVRLTEIIQRAVSGEEAAKETITRLQEKFAEAIAVPINILDPEAIVIGGGVGNCEILYTEETRQKIIPYIFNKELKTQFLKPTLGDSAGVFGAAML
ncbi:MAG TPA: ROK family protein [Chthoniobacterales bacterium]|nr:ROK family protein [Chthoniobacterales bacterium]